MHPPRRHLLALAWMAAVAVPMAAGCNADPVISDRTNAVRCECACGVGPFSMSRSVEVCIDREVQPSAPEGFSADDLTSLCESVCSGGVQAQAQESLVAEEVINDPCVVSCRLDGSATGLVEDACRAPGGDPSQRIDCEPDRCPVDLPGDPDEVRSQLLRCTTVVDDSRADPAACGPDRPTRPLCLIDSPLAPGDTALY